MKLSDFDFTLPERLIAKYPLTHRSESRLLVLKREEQMVYHQQFSNLLDFVVSGDVLVLNDSKVIPARLLGEKDSGGRIEVLVERLLGERRCLAHVRASKSPKPQSTLWLEEQITLRVLGRQEDLYELELMEPGALLPLLERYGRIPLPPYLARPAEELDKSRYQTVYAEHSGSVAAPTAGLHFDVPMLAALRQKGVQIVYLTLHVGAGTFQPVRVEDITQHRMHPELITVPESVVETVQQAKAQGNKVIAVGTTSVRSLESAAAQTGGFKPFVGESSLFIYPGYQFKVVDAMVTNFHLPKSSLLMLISAFAGLDSIRHAYIEAIQHQYRFFSYGDAMLIL